MTTSQPLPPATGTDAGLGQQPASAPGVQVTRRRGVFLAGPVVLLVVAFAGFWLNWQDPQIGGPLRAGLDFKGGTVIQVELACADPGPCAEEDLIRLPVVREALAGLPAADTGGDQPAVDVGNMVLQPLDDGAGLLLRSAALSTSRSRAVVDAVAEAAGPLRVGRTQIDTIGPVLGADLLRASLWALTVAFFGVAAYIAVRFTPVYGSLALGALFHDLLIVGGLFAWLGRWAGIEVDSLFAVALLTLAGYSVNDTVVVFDRIREITRLQPQLSLRERVDRSIGASFRRSLYTSISTELPLVALACFSSGGLRWFAIALAVGIAVGTYSSLFVAPLLLTMVKSSPHGTSASRL